MSRGLNDDAGDVVEAALEELAVASLVAVILDLLKVLLKSGLPGNDPLAVLPPVPLGGLKGDGRSRGPVVEDAVPDVLEVGNEVGNLGALEVVQGDLLGPACLDGSGAPLLGLVGKKRNK